MLLIVHVSVHVKPDRIDAFKAATVENARHSLDESGVVRFDVLQQAGERGRFVLTEVYRSPEAAAAHKETIHYLRWRDAVADMMAEPRSSVKFENIFPADGQW
jgi:quinol monooxygenase YgiN